MTHIEKELIAAISELAVAVRDIHYQLSDESRKAQLSKAASEEALLRRGDLLELCGQCLASAQQRLRRLGYDPLK